MPYANVPLGNSPTDIDQTTGANAPCVELVTNISGTLTPVTAANPLPVTDAAAEAALATIGTNTTPVAAGAKTSANSFPVVTATDDANVGPAIRIAGTPAAAVNNLIIAATNVAAYAYATFAFNVPGSSCTITFEASNDTGTPSNWWSVGAQRLDLQSISPVSPTLNSSAIVALPLGFQWLRVRCSTYGSGSPTGDLSLHPRPLSMVASLPQTITPISVTTQGPANSAHLVAAATSNATSVKTSVVVLAELTAGNSNATTTYFLKIFNKASAPTVGTDVPVAVYPIPPKTFISVNVGPFGKRLSTGFALCIVAGTGLDTDTTAVTTTGDVVVSWNY